VFVDLRAVRFCVDLFALYNKKPLLFAAARANRDGGDELTRKLANLGKDFLILRRHD
jgi:hypothetical protein